MLIRFDYYYYLCFKCDIMFNFFFNLVNYFWYMINGFNFSYILHQYSIIKVLINLLIGSMVYNSNFYCCQSKAMNKKYRRSYKKDWYIIDHFQFNIIYSIFYHFYLCVFFLLIFLFIYFSFSISCYCCCFSVGFVFAFISIFTVICYLMPKFLYVLMVVFCFNCVLFFFLCFALFFGLD